MADVFGTIDPDILDAADGVTDFGDRIYGLGGADEIYGLGGRDLLDGGAGGDYLDGGDGVDIAIYDVSALTVFVSLRTSSGVGGDANGDIYVSIEDVIGSKHDDVLEGDDNANFINGIEGNNTIKGGGGNDHLNAYQGNDNMSGEDGDDRIFSSNGDDTLDGGAGDDDLAGSVGTDSLSGGEDNDTLEGGEGADTLNGGNGNDTASYGFGAAANLIISLTAGTASDGDTLTSIENVIGGGYDDTITGDANVNQLSGSSGKDVLDGFSGADILNGNTGDDILVGNAGADALTGGDGIDRASYSSSNAAVTVNLELGSAAGGHAGGDALSEIEGLAGSGFNDVLTGNNAEANRLSGNSGNDTVSGLAGDDLLEGDAGDDRLAGGAGADVLDGGAGSDRADYTASNASVTINLAAGNAAGGDAQGDSLIAIENVTGSSYADALLGDAAANRLSGANGDDLLTGGGGDDTLEGGAGADEIYGGAGKDAADYAGSNATVQVNLGLGTAAGGHAVGDSLALVENIFGSAFGDTLTGDAGANVLEGRVGNDTLTGGGGNDSLFGGSGVNTMTGGAGDDWYFVDNATDAITEAAGQGALDRVFASVSYTLSAGAQIEIFSTNSNGGTGPIDLTGNALANTIYGNAGANSLNGMGGADTLVGFGGNDFFFVDNAADAITEGTGQGAGDRVFASVNYTLGAGDQVEIMSTTNNGGVGAINLTGNEFANSIFGNAGVNVLNGGLGNDTLVGLGGADFFLFNAALNAATNVDRISGFSVADDAIRLENAIFTTLAAGALPVGAFRIGAVAADADDRIIYNSTTGALIYDSNGNVAGGSTQFATLAAALALTSADFVVV